MLECCSAIARVLSVVAMVLLGGCQVQKILNQTFWFPEGQNANALSNQ